MKTKLTIFILLFTLIFTFSCSKTEIQKSAIQQEAEKLAQQWWENSIAKCEDSFVTKYQGSKISVGTKVMFMQSGYLQFKDLTFLVEEQPLTEADKLNGIEWKGSLLLIPIKPTLRFYDDSDRKWSEWQQEAIIYSPDLFYPSLSKKGSPFLRDFKKLKGKWDGLWNDYGSGGDFTKPQCSEIPKS